MADVNGSVDAVSCADFPATARWIMSAVPAPVAGRSRRQDALLTERPYQLKNALGINLTCDLAKVCPAQIGIGDPTTKSYALNYARYGDSVSIYFISGSGLVFLKPNAMHTGLEYGVGGDAWTIIDPAGAYKNGDRVRVGAKVCFRDGAGMSISADPTAPILELSPNCSPPEHWTIERP